MPSTQDLTQILLQTIASILLPKETQEVQMSDEGVEEKDGSLARTWHIGHTEIVSNNAAALVYTCFTGIDNDGNIAIDGPTGTYRCEVKFFGPETECFNLRLIFENDGTPLFRCVEDARDEAIWQAIFAQLSLKAPAENVRYTVEQTQQLINAWIVVE